MYMINFSVKTLCLTCRVYFNILRIQDGAHFLRWPPNVLHHKLNYVTCLIFVLNYICFVRRVSFS